MTYIDRVASRRLDVGRVFERAVSSVGGRVAGLLLVSFAFAGLPQMLMTWGQMGLASGYGGTSGLSMSSGWLLTTIGGAVIQGLVAYIVIADFQQRKPGVGEALRASGSAFVVLLGLSIVSSLGIIAGAIILIVPGVILALMWSVAAPVVVGEKAGVFESMRRSRELTRNNRLMILLLFAVGFVASLVVELLLGMVARAVVQGWAEVVAAGISGTIGGLIWGALAAALYVELRLLKEGGGREDVASIFD